MMGIWQSLAGTIGVDITSADIPGALKLLTDRGIYLNNVEYISDLSVCATVSRKDFRKVKALLKARGDRCDTYGKWGVVWSLHQIKKRPVFLIGLSMLTILSLYIPSRILFIQVQGNNTVSYDRIVQTANQKGLFFGCSRSKLRSEQLKNALLEQIPELNWIGITSSGCVATIEVKEDISDDKIEQSSAVSSLVALCDGVVESVTVTNGTPLCKPGQVVHSGQVLISGYQDHGLLIKASNAQGEVYARTYRSLRVITPLHHDVRVQYDGVSTNFSVQIGKKQINFSQDSGISPTGCVKMYEKKYLMLPGGFQLPAALIIERVYPCRYEPFAASPEAFSWTEHFADQYIADQMIAGKVISKDLTAEQTEDAYVLSAEYSCREQIGQKRIEESLSHNGENS